MITQLCPEKYRDSELNTNFQLLILQVHDRGGWTTYSDLMVLSRTLELIKVWETLYEYTLKVTAVCAFAYAASLMTMLGTCQLLSNRSTYQGMEKISVTNFWLFWVKKSTVTKNPQYFT